VKRQRDYMQKTVVTLKRALKQAKGEAATKAKAAMSENSLLISECNHLRKEGRELHMKLDESVQTARQLEQKMQLIRASNPMSSMSMQSYGGQGVGGPESEGQDGSSGMGMGGILPPALSQQSTSASGGGVSSAGPRGRLIKGSTRPLVEVSSTRGKVSGMLAQLDDNNREIELQRGEIRRLREQVHLLVSQLSKGRRLDALSPPPQLGQEHSHASLGPQDSVGSSIGNGMGGMNMVGMPMSQSAPHMDDL